MFILQSDLWEQLAQAVLRAIILMDLKVKSLLITSLVLVEQHRRRKRVSRLTIKEQRAVLIRSICK